MLTSVEFETPVCQKEKAKLETDHQVLKQLIANIERNRVKWRAQLDDDCSHQKRQALLSVKDKLDKQAYSLSADLEQLEDRIALNERKGQILGFLKEKLE
jgi:hypothetical protein